MQLQAPVWGVGRRSEESKERAMTRVRNGNHGTHQSESRSRRSSSVAVSPYFVEDVAMTRSEWLGSRSHDVMTVSYH
jgi:hypothetical protein